jgi:hypothetical protein
MGNGPMTGRGMGFCAGVRGTGNGFGGRGRRNRLGGAMVTGTGQASSGVDDQINALEQEAQTMEAQLKNIQEQINRMKMSSDR